VKTTQAARRHVRFLGVAMVAMLVCLAASTGAGAGGKDPKPTKPANDTPSATGLAGPGVTSTSTTTTTTTTTRGGKNGTITTTTATVGNAAPGAVGSTTLVLYDTTGAYGWLGELYATYAGNLASHFGNWKAEPVTSYQAGQISQYTATIYIGSTYDEPLPTAFLDDVYSSTRPVIWIYDNIWQLTNRYATTFQSKYGWMWSQFDLSTVSHVLYKGATLSRDGADNQAGIMGYSAVDTTKATVLAWAVRDSDGSEFPWALRSGTLTYVGENPFVYTGETDRVIAFEDLLFDALNPSAPTRHRALVRLEDISPVDDVTALKQITDYLYSQGIPFGFEFTPEYTDPNGYYNNGVPQTVPLQKRTAMANTILYMEQHGGTLVAHGYTHQYSNIANPFTAVTGDDAEFYRLILNPDYTLDYAGPVAEDSTTWALNRMDSSLNLFTKAGVGTPQMWTFPDYVASATDYAAAAQRFSVRWERALYFGGVLSGGTIDSSHVIGQTFPYLVRDAYGTTVVPENLGDYSPQSFYSFPPHTIANILAAGTANMVVRDGFGSFFYHAYEGLSPLQQIIDGLRAQGWTFVSPTQVAANG
jgi:uncharacterized protein YdaL